MKTDRRINLLRRIIKRQLTERITSDYVYLDLPYHQNIGDLLIWSGTEQFLSTLPYRCLYRSSCDKFDQRPLSPDVVIVMHGGGNFGDLWSIHQKFRLKVIENYPDNRIVILPQTVYYEDERLFDSDAAVMRKHRHLTICARDRRSYRMLKEHDVASDIIVLPDMAFCISDEVIGRWRKMKSARDRVLFVKRGDKELADSCDYEQFITKDSPCEVHDWPSYECFDDEVLNEFLYHKKTSSVERLNDYAREVYLPYMLDWGASFLTGYKQIYTTRLHAAILSMLMHSPVVVFDNSYGKNSAFFETWMTGLDLVRLAGRRISVWRQVKDYLWMRQQLSE